MGYYCWQLPLGSPRYRPPRSTPCRRAAPHTAGPRCPASAQTARPWYISGFLYVSVRRSVRTLWAVFSQPASCFSNLWLSHCSFSTGGQGSAIHQRHAPPNCLGHLRLLLVFLLLASFLLWCHCSCKGFLLFTLLVIAVLISEIRVKIEQTRNAFFKI